MPQFAAGLICAICALAVTPRPAEAAAISAAVADRMTAACVSYAKAHHGAVNIWVYDSTGEVVHFERMDGAPGIGSPPGSPPQGRIQFDAAIDPNAFDPADPGDVRVSVANQNIGRIRVQGMGPGADHACALAAAAAAK